MKRYHITRVNRSNFMYAGNSYEQLQATWHDNPYWH